MESDPFQRPSGGSYAASSYGRGGVGVAIVIHPMAAQEFGDSGGGPGSSMVAAIVIVWTMRHSDCEMVSFTEVGGPAYVWSRFNKSWFHIHVSLYCFGASLI
jgi:uncharacterized membrane protein